MKDYRPQIKSILESIKSDTSFQVKMAFPESRNEGNVISFFEINNTSTSIEIVDSIAFQIDVWADSFIEMLELMDRVDECMVSTGLLREYVSPDSMMHDASGYYRKTLRYGRRVETDTNRLID